MKKKSIILALSAVICLTATCLPFRGAARENVKTEEYSWQNVEIVGGGYVPGIIFNEGEKDLIYARTDMGGVYRWNPKTERWIPLTDWVGFTEWNLLGGESIATDPVETNRVYVAAGTYTNDWTSMKGYILRSTDKGDTWDRVELPFKLGGNMPGRSVGERLVIDPNKNSDLYLGSRTHGLWKSEDYGVTWNKVEGFTELGNYFSSGGSGGRQGISWIEFDKTTGTQGEGTKDIYIGLADTNNSIYKSSDGGVTWNAIEGQPHEGYIPHHGEIDGNGDLYISYSDGAGPYDGDKGSVYKYSTKTGEWTDITPVTAEEGCHWGYGGLSVDTKNPGTVIVSGLNTWWPDENIYRTTDGGETWEAIWMEDSENNERLTKYTQDISAAPWLDWGIEDSGVVKAAKLGWMMGDIDIDPFDSDRMMYGTGATIYGSKNLTNWDDCEEYTADMEDENKVKIEVMAQGIEETNVLGLISPPEGAPLLSAMGDIGGFRHDDLTKSPQMGTNPVFGTTTTIDYAELKPSIIVKAGAAKSSIAYSEDGGETWNPTTNPQGCQTGKVVISAEGKTILWTPNGSDRKVRYSTDKGVTWNESTGIPAGATIASDRVNDKKFYGYLKGEFYCSEDGGVTFNKTSATILPPSGTIDLKAMPGIEGDIWLAGGTGSDYGIWHSVNGGEEFVKLDAIEQGFTIGFGKAAKGKKYMTLYTCSKIDGTIGIYRSIDAGESWVRINDDEHQYGCTNRTITGDPRVFGRVYLGTNGRGIIYGDSSYIEEKPEHKPENDNHNKPENDNHNKPGNNHNNKPNNNHDNNYKDK